jgi:hypothetical protein
LEICQLVEADLDRHLDSRLPASLLDVEHTNLGLSAAVDRFRSKKQRDTIQGGFRWYFAWQRMSL